MVSAQAVDEQLKRIGFNKLGWGKAEIRELPHIILPDEEIYECVNGIYEGGFALLIATDVRVLLVDKKPFNYLTVEDLRFDMINEIDYSHRMMGAYISITSGDKNLKFRSYNQPRLRKLINHVQHCMANSKKQQNVHQEGQKQHLEQINQQLQTYLKAQFEHQQELREQLKQSQPKAVDEAQWEPPKPSPELSDYLFAQSLLNQYQQQTGQPITSLTMPSASPPPAASASPAPNGFSSLPPTPAPVLPPESTAPGSGSQLSEIYAEGMQEIFGKRQAAAQTPEPIAEPQARPILHLPSLPNLPAIPNPLEINPLRIAYSKLPMALRNRKFNRPSAPSFPAPSRQ